jgi:hypothetical protein
MLDTRTKIVPAQVALARLAERPLIAAYFDPLVVTHTNRFRELAEKHGPLAICICEPPDPLLPAQARAELAAACRDVDIVVIGEMFLSQTTKVIDERPGDMDRRTALMQHVHSRQNG